MSETPFKGEGPGAVDFAVLHPSPANAVTLWCATQILRAAGLSVEDATTALRQVYGVEVPKEVITAWFTTVPKFVKRACARTSGLAKLVQLIESRRLEECLWALRYVAGAAVGDGDKYGRLRVKDWRFAHVYSLALAYVIGDLERVRVRKTKDGRYEVGKNRLVSFILRSELWKVLAFLDKFDEQKHFLAGLMDAEGSVSPLLNRKSRTLRVQFKFANTNAELVEYVEGALRELGLNCWASPKLSDVRRLKGKILTRARSLFQVYTIVRPSELMTFARRVGFRCSRKLQLLGFFIMISLLPPRLRFELFLRHWTKIDGRWKPTSCSEQMEQIRLEQPHRQRQQRAQAMRIFVVFCRRCKQEGVLALRKVGTQIQIQVVHEDRECTVDTLEGDEDGNVKCENCGKPGRIRINTDKETRRGHHYRYVKIRVEHYSDKKVRRYCFLMRLPLLEVKPSQASTTQSAKAEQDSPTPAIA